MNKWITIILAAFAVSAQAMPDAQVQAVQMPAWMQRDGQTRPLRVGTELRNGDRLITGNNARVYVQTADGSTVKLGAGATLTLDGLSQQRDDQSLFTGVLDVLQGAFRFTTSAVARLQSRAVTIKLAGASLGIRGTDVWGKDGTDAQGEDLRVVCLIEGKIAVTGSDAREFVMDQPLSFYKMPADAAPLPVAPVDPEQLNKWAAETEIAQPAVQVGGRWQVELLVAPTQDTALAAYDEWRAAGYDVRLRPIAHDVGWQYALDIARLPDRQQAEALADALRGKMGADNPRASR